MQNLFLYSVVFSLGLVSFITCFAAEFKRTKKEDIRWDTERNCYIPGSHAFGLGTASVLCFCLAQIVGNIVVFRNRRTRIKREDEITDLTLPTLLLLLSWSSFVVVVLMLSTATSMSRVQPYGEGWLEEDCYLVKDGVFAASGCLAILGLGALTISATKIKVVKKQPQQLVVQVVIKDQDQDVVREQTKSEEEEEEQNHHHDEHETNKTETVIYLVEEASSTTDISRI